MKRLTVLYDERCRFCRRCALWLGCEAQYVPIQTLGRGTKAATERFGAALADAGDDQMIVVSDDGAVWRGTGAYLICMWALRRYRRWSVRLSRPALRPLVRGAFMLIARNRLTLSRLMRGGDEAALADELRRNQPVRCANGAPSDPGERAGAP